MEYTTHEITLIELKPKKKRLEPYHLSSHVGTGRWVWGVSDVICVRVAFYNSSNCKIN